MNQLACVPNSRPRISWSGLLEGRNWSWSIRKNQSTRKIKDFNLNTRDGSIRSIAGESEKCGRLFSLYRLGTIWFEKIDNWNDVVIENRNSPSRNHTRTLNIVTEVTVTRPNFERVFS